MVMIGQGCSCDWLGGRLQEAAKLSAAAQLQSSDLINENHQQLQEGPHSSDVLILDCRSQDEHAISHIQDSIPICVPALIYRRLVNGTGSVMSVIAKDRWPNFEHHCKSGAAIVLYDQSGKPFPNYNSPTNNNNNNSVTPCDVILPTSSTSSSVLPLLMKKLEADGCRARYLEGGFKEFKQKYPELCIDSEQPKPDSSSTQSVEPNSSSKPDCRFTLPGADSPSGICTSVLPGLSKLHLADQPTPDPTCLDGKELCGRAPGSAYPFPVEVLPRLYLGNAENAASRECLKDHNIGYVLNVTTDIPNSFENEDAQGRIIYMRIPITDHLTQDLQCYFSQAIGFIDEGRRRGRGVLVHCLAGISRSVTVTVAYLMKKQSLNMDDAFDLLRRCKPNISPNFNFMGQLQDFEKTLKTSAESGERTSDASAVVESTTASLTNDVNAATNSVSTAANPSDVEPATDLTFDRVDAEDTAS